MKNNLTILPIPALNDNYIWMIIHLNNHQAVVIDPGKASPVHKVLCDRALKLKAILITHHHWDHTDGAQELAKTYSVPIYGPQHQSLAYCDHQLKGGEIVSITSMQLSFEIIAIPGHTLSHLAFYGNNWLFCGDTLFSAGCGRLFEGTPEQMLASLTKLTSLPPETEIYCGHEYTLKNLQFALKVEPNNKDVKLKFEQVLQLRNKNNPTLPSTIKDELRFNPFLRCKTESVKLSAEHYCKKILNNEIEIFATLRNWKNKEA